MESIRNEIATFSDPTWTVTTQMNSLRRVEVHPDSCRQYSKFRAESSRQKEVNLEKPTRGWAQATVRTLSKSKVLLEFRSLWWTAWIASKSEANRPFAGQAQVSTATKFHPSRPWHTPRTSNPWQGVELDLLQSRPWTTKNRRKSTNAKTSTDALCSRKLKRTRSTK